MTVRSWLIVGAAVSFLAAVFGPLVVVEWESIRRRWRA